MPLGLYSATLIKHLNPIVLILINDQLVTTLNYFITYIDTKPDTQISKTSKAMTLITWTIINDVILDIFVSTYKYFPEYLD